MQKILRLLCLTMMIGGISVACTGEGTPESANIQSETDEKSDKKTSLALEKDLIKSTISINPEKMEAQAAQNEEGKVQLEKATFGGGCFWCVEAVFQRIKGVEKWTSGYTGGKTKNPTYQEITTGFTGHAEVVQIEFDPKTITYDQLLDVFWRAHDPTTLNRQGADIGTQYRSAIYYHSEEQKEKALASKKRTDASNLWADPIVTEITKIDTFYPAEKYHQNYFNLNPGQGYCQVVIWPKLKKLGLPFKKDEE